jgi:hypothetical protein
MKGMTMSTATLPAETKPADTQIATRPSPTRLVSFDNGPNAHLFDTAKFEQSQRLALAMATASLIPKHLIGSVVQQTQANCLRIVNQAVRWGMDPFAIMDETYVVNGKLGYQGKLVAAVINARAELAQPLAVIFNHAKGDDLAAVVFGSKKPIPPDAFKVLEQFAHDELAPVQNQLLMNGIMAIRISVGQAKTDNQMWKKDPQQKLFYSGATKWARRWHPEIILGVVTDDDMDRINYIDAPAPRQSLIDLSAKLGANGQHKEHANGSSQNTNDATPAGEQPQPQPQPLPPSTSQADTKISKATLKAIQKQLADRQMTEANVAAVLRDLGLRGEEDQSPLVLEKLSQADAERLLNELAK